MRSTSEQQCNLPLCWTLRRGGEGLMREGAHKTHTILADNRFQRNRVHCQTKRTLWWGSSEWDRVKHGQLGWDVTDDSAFLACNSDKSNQRSYGRQDHSQAGLKGPLWLALDGVRVYGNPGIAHLSSLVVEYWHTQKSRGQAKHGFMHFLLPSSTYMRLHYQVFNHSDTLPGWCSLYWNSPSRFNKIHVLHHHVGAHWWTRVGGGAMNKLTKLADDVLQKWLMTLTNGIGEKSINVGLAVGRKTRKDFSNKLHNYVLVVKLYRRRRLHRQ